MDDGILYCCTFFLFLWNTFGSQLEDKEKMLVLRLHQLRAAQI